MTLICMMKLIFKKKVTKQDTFHMSALKLRFMIRQSIDIYSQWLMLIYSTVPPLNGTYASRVKNVNKISLCVYIYIFSLCVCACACVQEP